jgi:Ca2+-binding RTX toxin-like protein
MAMRKWGNEALVNTTTLNNQTAPVVTALKEGGYVIAWVDDMGLGDSVVRFQIYTAGGTKLGAEKTVVVGDGAGDQDQPTITTTANGNFIIGVRDFDNFGDHDTMAYEFTPYGANPGQLVRQTTIDSSAFNDGGAPVVDVLGAGNAYVYRQNGNFFAQQINTNGTVGIAETNLLISSTGNYPFDFATIRSGSFAGQSMIVTARGVGANHELIYTQPTSGLGASFNNVIATGLFPVEHVSVCAFQRTTLAQQSFIVAYEANNLVQFFQVINGSEAVFGAINAAIDPEVIAYTAGQYLISYRSAITLDVFIQLFDQAGGTIGQAVKVNTNEMHGNTDPIITVLSDGRIVVTWAETSGTNGTGSDILQQIFDPRDNIINGSSNPLLAETIYGNDGTNDEINGYAGNDTIYGLSGADVLYGGDGDDYLYGGRGDDTLYGGNNNDRLEGGDGADDIYGGAGNDTVSYRSSRSGVVINLLTGEGSAGDALNDNVFEVESILGSDFNDTITGGLTAGSFFGLKGDDTLIGSNFNDIFVGGLGADTINGLGGTADQAYYTSSLVNVTINLATNVNLGGEAQGDIITNVERISGSQFGDNITGTTGNQVFYGEGGDDVLNGGAGSDILYGGAGSDTFQFTAGQSGTVFGAQDFINDFTKGSFGAQDKIDYTNADLTVGGSAAAATATEASIGNNGTASFFAGSGLTLADCLSDISTRMTTAGDAAGEFAFFKVGAGTVQYMFISDGVAGVGPNDVLVQLTTVSSVNFIDITAGDVSILT